MSGFVGDTFGDRAAGTSDLEKGLRTHETNKRPSQLQWETERRGDKPFNERPLHARQAQFVLLEALAVWRLPLPVASLHDYAQRNALRCGHIRCVTLCSFSSRRVDLRVSV